MDNENILPEEEPVLKVDVITKAPKKDTTPYDSHDDEEHDDLFTTEEDEKQFIEDLKKDGS